MILHTDLPIPATVADEWLQSLHCMTITNVLQLMARRLFMLAPI